MKKTLIAISTLLFISSTAYAKTPIPQPEDLAKSTEFIEEEYKSDIRSARSARSTELMSALADKIFEKALKSGDNPSDQFALFSLAKQVYLDSGSHPKAVDLIDKIDKIFEIDPHSEKLEILADASKSREIDAYSRCLLSLQYDAFIKSAIGEGEYQLALELLEQSESNALKTGNRESVERAKDLANKVKDLMKDPAASSLEVIKEIEQTAVSFGVTGEWIKPERESTLAVDRHPGVAGRTHANNLYYLTSRSPKEANGLHLMVNGQMSRLTGSSTGKISISFDGQNWLHVANWTAEGCLQSAMFKNWQVMELTASKFLSIDKLAVKFEYVDGSERFDISQVAIAK